MPDEKPEPSLPPTDASSSTDPSSTSGIGTGDEKTLRDLHTLLLETEVREGKLVCGNCGHEYRIKEGIANFLLPSHLGEWIISCFGSDWGMAGEEGANACFWQCEEPQINLCVGMLELSGLERCHLDSRFETSC